MSWVARLFGNKDAGKETAAAGATDDPKYTARRKKIYLLFKPFQGSMLFGICKVFLEQQVQFPHTLRLSVAQEFQQSARIWYSHVDAFGAYRLEPMECFYIPDEVTGAKFEYVTVGRIAARVPRYT